MLIENITQAKAIEGSIRQQNYENEQCISLDAEKVTFEKVRFTKCIF